MTHRRLLTAFMIGLLAAGRAVAAAPDTTLSASSILTWTTRGYRVFLMTGGATMRYPSGQLTADNMVVWFDQELARETASLVLRVYSESGGTGSVAEVSATGRLVVDDRNLQLIAVAPDSAVLSRAEAALTEWRRARRAAATSAQAEETAALSAAPAGEAAPPSPEPAEGQIIIKRAPIDNDGYNLKTEVHDDVTTITIRGGIEMTFEKYTVRAENMVLWVSDKPGGQTLQIYAEENVSFRRPGVRLECSQIFFDDLTQRATLIDAEVHAYLSRADTPLILRASEVRAISKRSFKARDAYVTTCEFGLPHQRLQSDLVSVTGLTDAEGRESAMLVAEGNRFYLSNLPVMWLPRLARDVKAVYAPLRKFEAGNSNRFGTYVNTEWDLLDIFSGGSSESVSARISRWSDLSLLADYYDERGAAGGLLYDYAREGIRGEFLGYYVNDRGTDADGFAPSSEDRWRLKWRQRAFFEQIQIDTEFSRISDGGFLNEYFEREAKQGKEQETYIYAKRPWENSQSSLIYRARLNDFQSQTEYLPEVRYDVVTFPLSDGRLLYTSESRAGNLRMRPADALMMPSYQTQRLDSVHTIEAPLPSWEGIRIIPFATARGSWYDADTVGDDATRYVGSWGTLFSLPPLWRVWDVDSTLLDVHRLRHIAVFDVAYENVYDATRTPSQLLQFDEVDSVDTLETATLHLRQRLQTRRAAAVEGASDRTVDLVTFDAEADFFPKPQRDNSGQKWSDVRLYCRGNVTDDVSVLSDGEYDTYDGKFDKAGVWLRVDHSPRTTWGVGSRMVRGTTSGLTAVLDHRISDRWSVLLLSQYDYNLSSVTDQVFVLRRDLHRFVLEVSLDYDRGRDDTSVGMRIYPAGQPGKRNFY